MKKTSVLLVFTFAIISAILLTAFNPMPYQWVIAAAAPTRTPRAGGQANQDLSFTLQREQNWLDRQAIHLTRAANVAKNAQEAINKAKDKGLDVTALQNALNAFNDQIASAKTAHGQAADILSRHTGFDNSHNVTDSKAAHQTVLDARNALRQAHLTLVNTVLNLRTALQDWRAKNNLK